MNPASANWCTIGNVHEVPSPSLLLYPERIEENIRRMIKIAGGPAHLRPHLKTHKLAEVLLMQAAQGISRFKCATIAEAEMAAQAGVPDLLLAYQPVGPNVSRVVNLVRRFPSTRFSALADDTGTIKELSQAAARAKIILDVLLDLDCGMNRTGIAPGPQAAALYRQIAESPGLQAAGLHAYDGHIHDSDVTQRTRRCEEAFALVRAFRSELVALGSAVPSLVAGGTPTFPIHARRPDVECSPGTCVFWDAGYQTKLPDLDFLPAALVLSRVVSTPRSDLLCLDLGHKAIASENPHPRVQWIGLESAKAVGHSEEHLVLQTADAGRFPVGAVLYGVPWHICPTVALHAQAVVVREGRAQEQWRIVARDRVLMI